MVMGSGDRCLNPLDAGQVGDLGIDRLAELLTHLLIDVEVDVQPPALACRAPSPDDLAVADDHRANPTAPALLDVGHVAAAEIDPPALPAELPSAQGAQHRDPAHGVYARQG